MLFSKQKKLQMPAAHEALKGRPTPLDVPARHFVNGRALKGPWPQNLKTVTFGLGCFWGAERKFWQTPGVYSTAVGYSAGYTPNPTYEEVCSGMTGHNEVVLVVYDPNEITLEGLLKVFFESHDPTQGMRQGGDIGTQYRSGIYVNDIQDLQVAEAARAQYAKALATSGYGPITTEVMQAPEFYYAEDYHQQYLAKNPGGYCGIGGTGVACSIGTGVEV
ncbi:peptide-methionine (S)-S-oxide reductase MsrA [Aquidulcibacter sp.]|uniref:peptide-methionine (S)-S-oxide reductase MsrA n=1 Tax=Aquidulcibacter sp. TaxID=2052990 RepID=UPI0025B9138F|nr:peptide-methionine (S)-S-oxide reductase MsrA [Aquidulcibacter sp.]MCA3692225.1 peptide-methionine (S)-S-oxide reductase MsrA [Aquidulcibacter sp.]